VESLDHAYLAKLVEQCQRGSSNAFAELYAATYQRQYAYAVRVLGDVHLAQDALQEAYIRALKTIKQLQNPLLFAAWLNRINLRTCLDMKRRLAREMPLSDEVLETIADPAPSGTPEDEVVDIDSRNYVIKQVMNLPLTESQALMMRYYQDMSIDEIAATLDMSRSSVKRYIKSGTERLRRTVQ